MMQFLKGTNNTGNNFGRICWRCTKGNRKSCFKHAGQSLIPGDVAKAEKFWIMEVQKSMYKDVEKGRYKRLCPRKNTDGIYVVGGRGERWKCSVKKKT